MLLIGVPYSHYHTRPIFKAHNFHGYAIHLRIARKILYTVYACMHYWTIHEKLFPPKVWREQYVCENRAQRKHGRVYGIHPYMHLNIQSKMNDEKICGKGRLAFPAKNKTEITNNIHIVHTIYTLQKTTFSWKKRTISTKRQRWGVFITILLFYVY